MRKTTFWFPTWSYTNQAVQLQKMARGLKFWISKEGGFYYLCSENKGADQLRGYREADLRLCFRICKTLGFLMMRLICFSDVRICMKQIFHEETRMKYRQLFNTGVLQGMKSKFSGYL